MNITNSKYMVPEALVRDSLKAFGIRPTEAQIRAIQRYMELLLRWNQRFSLTGLREPREILRRHFGESMFAASAVPISVGRLADVGSGAGFPGLALKIACPALHVVLVEASMRKTVFLAEVVRSLEIDGVEIVRSRVEDFSASTSLEDFVAARAVGGFDRILPWSRKLLSDEGQILLWLGAADAQKASRLPGWLWREPIPIPTSQRRVLLVGRQAL